MLNQAREHLRSWSRCVISIPATIHSLILRCSRHRDFFPHIVFLTCFVVLSIYLLPIKPGAGMGYYLLIAKYAANASTIPDHAPHFCMNIQDGVKTFFPIGYPLTFSLLVCAAYKVGQVLAVKLLMFAFHASAAVALYYLFRHISRVTALVLGLVITVIAVLRSEYWGITVMEIPLTFFTVMSLLFLYRFLKSSEYRHAILAAAFAAFAASIKLQGLEILFVVVAIMGTTAVFRSVAERRLKPLMVLLPVALVVIAIAAAPLIDQVSRTGTLDNVPGDSALPFMTSKYPADAESVSEINSILPGYWPSYASPFHAMAEYVKIIGWSPWLLSAKSPGFWGPCGAAACSILGLLAILGVAHLWRRDRLLCGILLATLIVDVLTAYFTNTPIARYHIFGWIIACAFVLFGMRALYKALSARRVLKSAYLLLLLFLAAYTALLWINIHDYRYGRSGTATVQDPRLISAYQSLSEFVAHTPTDSTFLASEDEFIEYCSRDALWINIGGGSKVYQIFAATHEGEVLQLLKEYDIDYIVIDLPNQLRYHGSDIDYISGTGLLQYIDDSPHFAEVFSAFPNDTILKVYQVL